MPNELLLLPQAIPLFVQDSDYLRVLPHQLLFIQMVGADQVLADLVAAQEVDFVVGYQKILEGAQD